MNNDKTTITAKQEWLGESGYCNCLLVTMSRMAIARVDLTTSKPLPDLDALTKARPDSNAWIKAQNLDPDRLDRLTVIRMLAELAGISPKTGSSSGTIEVQDVVGDDGGIVQRFFEMELDFDGDEPTLAVIQRGIQDAEPGAAGQPATRLEPK
ncbi:MAG TPA: hypothetical protein PK529_11095 [Verrucomicrobiales bacterium]|nr:hypothetical protein [Verrucomicrobiales bacterium]